jgi:pimeloyl-ACP methyl ester carboxylesterase
VIDAEIERLLPHVKRFVIPGVGHQMWLQQGDFCRTQTAAFLDRLRI